MWTKKAKKKRKPIKAPKCPHCRATMVLRQTDKYLYKNGSPRLFYSCPNWPRCKGATAGADPDGRPTSTPAADDETKTARREAHAALEQLGNEREWTVAQQYEFIQRVLQMTPEQAHIGRFNRGTCNALVLLIELERAGQLPDNLKEKRDEDITADCAASSKTNDMGGMGCQ